ncbi:maleylpyruvate isomerase family mycothiol-dependent enzyme [Marisediminicola sp. LYQ85]|uniref:maleylpyruvate isomerase family mycothiol-dependent enzyme n=1 Tax=Marisediminicola sp. LYQ85 TaxID=3391062 RepID=UPI003983D5E6
MTKASDSATWNAVHTERRALIRDLESLEPGRWTTASLCPGWDVHDVLAHLVDSAKTTRLGFVRRMLAARFDFDRDNAAGVARERTRDPGRTLDRFRSVSSSTSTPPVALATRLVEAYVHGEDIRRPLGIDSDYPPEHVATALAYQVTTSVKIGGGKELAHGWRLVATDTELVHGDGPEVRAPAIALLLAISGRPVSAAELGGPGAPAFATTITKPS